MNESPNATIAEYRIEFATRVSMVIAAATPRRRTAPALRRYTNDSIFWIEGRERKRPMRKEWERDDDCGPPDPIL